MPRTSSTTPPSPHPTHPFLACVWVKKTVHVLSRGGSVGLRFESLTCVLQAKWKCSFTALTHYLKYFVVLLTLHKSCSSRPFLLRVQGDLNYRLNVGLTQAHPSLLSSSLPSSTLFPPSHHSPPPWKFSNTF